MTDTRLPDKWLLNPDLDNLSHGAWRLFTRALMFCNQQGTDGEILALYMRHIYPWGEYSDYVQELAVIGWMEITDKGFVIPGWQEKGQSTAAQVEHWLAQSRERQQRSRDKKKGSTAPQPTGDVTRDVGQDRSGQDRSGQAKYEETIWPEVRKPGEGPASPEAP
jgi:hypothetical protein